mmetsp:Transcript_3406/g.5749  ORF Transcript_3406/g.5749 Transcript_3406/m.5749 type:complete len:185 (+) Transcript_3406:1549-2103(+)
MGRIYTMIVQDIFEYTNPDEIQQNALLGATAMLSGYCRLTYSLTVMMLETTQSINLFIPMLITMLTSYGIGILFNKSLYNRALRVKQVPLLKNHVPFQNHNLRAKVVMKENPTTLPIIPSVQEIGEALQKGFKSFPVINISGQLVGTISSNFLIVLIKKEAWYSKTFRDTSEITETDLREQTTF